MQRFLTALIETLYEIARAWLARREDSQYRELEPDLGPTEMQDWDAAFFEAVGKHFRLVGDVLEVYDPPTVDEFGISNAYAGLLQQSAMMAQSNMNNINSQYLQLQQGQYEFNNCRFEQAQGSFGFSYRSGLLSGLAGLGGDKH